MAFREAGGAQHHLKPTSPPIQHSLKSTVPPTHHLHPWPRPDALRDIAELDVLPRHIPEDAQPMPTSGHTAREHCVRDWGAKRLMGSPWARHTGALTLGRPQSGHVRPCHGPSPPTAIHSARPWSIHQQPPPAAQPPSETQRPPQPPVGLSCPAPSEGRDRPGAAGEQCGNGVMSSGSHISSFPHWNSPKPIPSPNK